MSIVVMAMPWILIVKHLKKTTPTQNKHLRHWNTSLLKELRTSTFHKLGTIIILQSKDLILLLWQLDVELNVVRSAWITNYEGFRFLFKFIWSKSVVTKQILRTKFITRLQNWAIWFYSVFLRTCFIRSNCMHALKSM